MNVIYDFFGFTIVNYTEPYLGFYKFVFTLIILFLFVNVSKWTMTQGNNLFKI